jgi:hypothetical protein
MLVFIAESTTLDPIIGIDHITTFFQASFLSIRWSDVVFGEIKGFTATTPNLNILCSCLNKKSVDFNGQSTLSI